MAPRSRLPLVLRACTGILLLAGAGAALTVQPDESGSASEPRGSVDAGATLASGSVSSPSTEATTTTSVAPTTAAAPAVAPAPAPGEYRYQDTTTAPDGKGSESTRTVSVTKVGDEPGVVVQHLTTIVRTGSGDAGAVATVAWSAGGSVVRELVVRLYGGTFTCDWAPDHVDRPAVLAPGASWSYEATCTGKVSGGQLDGSDVSMRERGSHEVTGEQEEEVGGRGVAAVTITGATDLEMTVGDLRWTSRTEGTEQYAPSLGMPVSADTTVTVESFGQRRTSRTASRLVASP